MIKIALSGLAGLAIGAYAVSNPPIAIGQKAELALADKDQPAKTVSIDTTELTRQARDLPVC